ncbi:MAG: hypothetical protein WAS33_29355 [Candidatus Promineifilaceae bacterium]|nr:hypothetical protein [Anaerolineaceae bacterium]
MEEIIIRVKDKDKAKALYDLLRALDFVDSIATDSRTENADEQIQEDEAFFSVAGIWSDRDISQESLRQKAWPHRS